MSLRHCSRESWIGVIAPLLLVTFASHARADSGRAAALNEEAGNNWSPATINPAAPASPAAASSGSCSARPAKDCGCGSAKVSICRVDHHGKVDSKCVDPDKLEANDYLPASYVADVDDDGYGDAAVPGFLTCDEPLGCVADGSDCDDANPEVNPAATEVCNLIDDNCDGATDDLGTTTCGAGVCVNTIDNCSGGVDQVCDPLLGSSAEKCDLLDNDCNGLVDDGLGTLSCGLGVCAGTIASCVCGVSQVCDPLAGASTEVCNLVDDDCDGAVDDGLGTTTCGRGVCVNTVANCTAGVPQICDPYLGQVREIRDGLDNDCDGFVDDLVSFPGDGQPGHGPALSYTDNGDGTVTDNNTGFMWEQKVAGGGSCLVDLHAVDARCNWFDAIGPWIAALNAGAGYAGYTDWRLPNAKELQSIVDYSRFNPSSDPALGPTASSLYWSATSTLLPTEAWGISFGSGNVSDVLKIGSGQMRAVRSGP